MGNIDLFQVIRLNDEEKFYSEIDDVDINQVNEDGQNMLHEAVAYNNLPFAKALIKRNIDVNHRDIKSQTPLHYAANHGFLDIAELILNSGGSLNIEDDYGNQPTWTAVFNARGNYEIVKCFLKFKPDISHKNRAGRSPLDFANQINDQNLIHILNSVDASF
ncbi:ankyrin repeat domain-containing protein [Methylomonas albis]|uniref:Ankyrin repeat domain-containing protein n=1 Tax=Methylomonas albis TaxID=1854563 RepID=A0ABR9CVU7_9GAMM|nr:ankyrin repeat domain-containing protein [Methylomonas albis]MBD9354546.1 ankyrin repeat domain-containing protein [Methylomonas albis]